ncbi:2-aminobenzoate-CoA ligase, partial [Pantoea dispersa]|nr:2-aminobenzoate-CoA ligase [Pantoea dispersa]
WLGVLKAGAVVVTTMPMLRSTEVSTLIELTKPVVAISDHRFVDELLVAAGEDVTVLTYGADKGFDDDGDLASRCGHKSGKFTAVDTAADDVA